MMTKHFKKTAFLVLVIFSVGLLGSIALVRFIAANLKREQEVEMLESYRQDMGNPDLVVQGTVIGVKNLDETNLMVFKGNEVELRGVETTFKISEVSDVFKVKLATNIVTLHHYRLDPEDSTNGPETIWFAPDKFNDMAFKSTYLSHGGLVRFTPNSSNEFVLALVVDGTNRFAPSWGQLEPSKSITLVQHPWDMSYKHDADPAIREEYEVKVPTRLSVKRIKGILAISADWNSFEYTNFTIGTEMVVGGWCEVHVTAAGMSRPTNYYSGLDMTFPISPRGGGKQNLFDWLPYFWRPDGDGVAVSSAPWIQTGEGSVDAATKYDVEEDLTIFETDSRQVESPSWNPKMARYYRVLWQGTLKQTVE